MTAVDGASTSPAGDMMVMTPALLQDVSGMIVMASASLVKILTAIQ